MFYASGIRSLSGAVILSLECDSPIIVTPVLDFSRVESEAPRGFEVYAAFRRSDEKVDLPVQSRKLINASITDAALSLAKKCGGPVGADLDFVDYRLGSYVIKKDIINLSNLIIESRIIKNRYEIELIEKAASIAEEAFRRVLPQVRGGSTETGLAIQLESETRRAGAWKEAFPSIVAFYANTAYPHHIPSSAKLTVEGPVLIDWGAIYRGYHSDETRTLYYGKAPRGFKAHYEILLEAQLAALDSVEPGVEAREVDAKAREVLRRASLEKYFIHGLGHGVGVNIHEEPYLRPGSRRILEEGMVITIEPGIYFPGLYGIRIEDTIVVTKTGGRLLTRIDKILLEL